MTLSMIEDLEFELMNYCIYTAGSWWNHLPFCRTKKIMNLYARLRSEPVYIVHRILDTLDHEQVLKDKQAALDSMPPRPNRRNRRKKRKR